MVLQSRTKTLHMLIASIDTLYDACWVNILGCVITRKLFTAYQYLKKCPDYQGVLIFQVIYKIKCSLGLQLRT